MMGGNRDGKDQNGGNRRRRNLGTDPCQHLQEHPLAEVTAICDLNRANAEAAAEKLGVSLDGVYTDYREMLARRRSMQLRL